jgi:hypothetical protein
MSRKGNCWDNAPTESFFNSLKNERVHGASYATRNEAASDLFQYIAVFYNRAAATPHWDICRRPRSCRTGSHDRISKKWQHEDDRLEDGKRRAPQFLNTCDRRRR